ncbi:hypothetical protein EUTSA_v10015965mg [Eutrema salsugineum]|uniref:Uncharacterized protein n=1 Tax=Eutrema salsugineum TaxID=72664 RepID=V4N435_EUTSA|nr:UPF0503 protein At3g09070, chloroplastic [Eutrema salsugineum]XP_024011616.1 UPF0503 protein At3g09070, chloroplastic [Eutrema salsugineum]ESQ40101.1 hypothetical protein EUTSA_v10015965mg [Eutrema salsugineum]
MNPSTDQTSAVADELAPPTQPHRLSTSCDLHPDERFSGFCPSCLCERLSVLDDNGAPPPSYSRKPPAISAAALKALFKPSSSNNNNNNNNANGRVRPGFFPELRRTKSFSAKNNEGFSSGFEPQRRSCDVRLRDEHRNIPIKEAATVVSGGKIEDEVRKSSVSEAVFEVSEEEAAETEKEEENRGHSEIVNDSCEITEEKSGEIVEVEEKVISEAELKPMKDYMDLYPQTKKPSVRDFAGSLFSAASVFSKKLQKWRQKQKMKKPRSGGGGGGRPQLPVEKATTRSQFRDTQSEIAEYGFGRRSSDTDPRFSLDAGRFSVDIGRISIDDSRYSLDEPRASWDGHLIGRTALPPAARVPPPPSLLSVVENAPMRRPDMHIPAKDASSPSTNPINGESDPIIIIPGGSTQTRDYYTEPPSRRRKSLDRSNSIKINVSTETDEVKSVSNSKVSPAITADSNSRTLKDDHYMEAAENKVNQNSEKKSRRWGKWSMLGFIYRKGVVTKDEEEDRYSRSNSTGMVERSLSESWPELRSEGGGPKMRRSNSNVSWRSSGGGSSRNKSWRHSSKDGENGMLRFYLTPSWRTGGGGGGAGGGGSGWEKTAARANSQGHSIARRVMRLY